MTGSVEAPLPSCSTAWLISQTA